MKLTKKEQRAEKITSFFSMISMIAIIICIALVFLMGLTALKTAAAGTATYTIGFWLLGISSLTLFLPISFIFYMKTVINPNMRPNIKDKIDV